MSQYRLVYFNTRGRAELCRLVLVAADASWEDVRLTKEEWLSYKHSTENHTHGFFVLLQQTSSGLGVQLSFCVMHHTLGPVCPPPPSLSEFPVSTPQKTWTETHKSAWYLLTFLLLTSSFLCVKKNGNCHLKLACRNGTVVHT